MKSLKTILLNSKLLAKITGIAFIVIVFFSTIIATELLDDIADAIQNKINGEETTTDLKQ